MKNSDNKNDLYIYLAEKFIGTPLNQQQLVVTYNNTVLTNIENIVGEDEIFNCNIEEADQRIIRHLINCVRNGLNHILVCTDDTDVLRLLISVLSLINEQYHSNIVYRFGIGENIKYYNINEICLLLTNDVCRALSRIYRA